MEGGGVKRLREGKTLLTIIQYLLTSNPKGLKRSVIQQKLIVDLGVGESTGGVNRQLKKLRLAALIDWNQVSYTYTLPQDYDSKDYFMRIVETLNLTTDESYFLYLQMQGVVSAKTLMKIDDYIGFRYEEEMGENMAALESEYKMNEIRVHDNISKIISHHNSYVRLRLFKTANESFIRDLAQVSETKGTSALMKSYSVNLKSIEHELHLEMEHIFKLRAELIKYLKEKRLSRRMKFLVRFTLKNIRPSLVYDGLI